MPRMAILVTPTGLATLRVPLPGRRHGKVLQKALHPSAAYGFYYVIPYVSKLPTGWHKKASQLRCGAFFELCSGDSYRIQTCNLLIRSQMLYSVELRSRVKWSGTTFILLFYRALCLFDAGLLSSEVAEIEDACTTYFTNFVEFDLLDER